MGQLCRKSRSQRWADGTGGSSSERRCPHQHERAEPGARRARLAPGPPVSCLAGRVEVRRAICGAVVALQLEPWGLSDHTLQRCYLSHRRADELRRVGGRVKRRRAEIALQMARSEIQGSGPWLLPVLLPAREWSLRLGNSGARSLESKRWYTRGCWCMAHSQRYSQQRTVRLLGSWKDMKVLGSTIPDKRWAGCVAALDFSVTRTLSQNKGNLRRCQIQNRH